MPCFCAVVKCGTKAGRDHGIRFFRIPSSSKRGRGQKVYELSAERREKWLIAIKREDLTEQRIKYARVCSKHFHSGQPADLEDVENPDWVPSLHMGYKTKVNENSVERYLRIKKRKIKISPKKLEEHHENDGNIKMDDSAINTGNANVDKYVKMEVEAEISRETLEKGLLEANKEIYRLRDELKRYKLSEDYLRGSDKDVFYYLGFPDYSYFERVLKVVEAYLPIQTSLTRYQQLLLTLMKLKLNYDFTDLGHRFQCHPTTAARTFNKVIDILYCRLICLITWPSREALHKTMPQCFKNIFGSKTVVIVNYFEVLVEKPTNLDASSKMWSNREQHRCMKFLIGISPQGVIIYISDAYTGGTRDKFITEESGFLNKLQQGDVILTDRGFSIDFSANVYSAEVCCPAGDGSKKQLVATEVESTRKLASVRIHVERVIGLLKTRYKIFQAVFPLMSFKKKGSEYASIDKIVVVCSALLNLCPGVIPLE